MLDNVSILVIDDEPEILSVIVSILGTLGCKTTEARSIAEALRKLPACAPEIILTDVTMPEKGGLDLLKEIGGEDKPYEIILMSGDAKLETALSALEHEAFGYLIKPISPENLHAMVRRAVAVVRSKRSRLAYYASLEAKQKKRKAELDSLMQAILTQNRRHDAIVNSMKEGLLAVDNDDNVMMMNVQMQEIIGRRFVDLAGENLWTSVADTLVIEGLRPLLAEMRLGRLPKHGALICSSDGHYYQVTAAEIVDAHSKHVGVIMLFMDVSDTIAADKLRTAFLTVVSHELRTPLNVMSNYLSILSQPVVEKPVFADIVGDLWSISNRMKEMVNNLIWISSLSSSTLVPEKKAVDMRTFIEKQVEAFHGDIAERNLTADIDMGSAVPVVLTDPALLSIAVHSLLSNAVKFSPPQGHIRISVCPPASGAGFAVHITDSGPGVPDATRSRLFEEFTQGEDPLVRRHGGMGAGLYLVKRVAAILGGTPIVSMAAGGGSTFGIELSQ